MPRSGHGLMLVRLVHDGYGRTAGGVAAFGMLAAGSATAIAAPSVPSVVHCARGDVHLRRLPAAACWLMVGRRARSAEPAHPRITELHQLVDGDAPGRPGVLL
jgi:hypothetical protein